MRNRQIRLRNRGAASGASREPAALRPDDVARARAAVLERSVYRDVASLFGALADPTRVSIVHVLAEQELCTADLALTLGLTRPATSQQLRVLRDLRIVRPRREGRLVLYGLDDAHIADLLRRGLEHRSEPRR